MTLSPTMPTIRRRRISPADEDVLRNVLDQQRGVRTDQLEALRWVAAVTRLGEPHRRALAAARVLAAEIDEALNRMNDGSYGWCVRCAGAIETSRLFTVPTTRFCLGCAP